MSMPEPYRRDDGAIMVPTRAENEDGTAVGIGYQPLTEDHPQYDDWVAYVGSLEGADWATRAVNGAAG